jgi:hypothetical protein
MCGTNIAIVYVNSHDIIKVLHNVDIKFSFSITSRDSFVCFNIVQKLNMIFSTS